MRPGPTCRSRRGTPLAACESTRCGRRAAARSRELTRRFSAGPKPGRISFYAELGRGVGIRSLPTLLDMLSKKQSIEKLTRPDSAVPLFEDLRHIFRDHADTTTPIDAFLWPLVTRDRHQKLREKPLVLNWGNVDALSFSIQPLSLQRTLRAPALVSAIATIYNDQYWLFALWSRFSAAAQGSALSRAIVRAFIKNSVFVTVEEIARYSNRIDADQATRHGRTSTVYYYKRVFDWTAIWQCIQLPARRKIKKRLIRTGQKGRELDFSAACLVVPELIEIFAQLHDVAKKATDQKEDYDGILKTTKLMIRMIFDKRRIQNAIRNLVKDA